MNTKEELKKKFKEWYDKSYYFNSNQEWVPPQPETIFEFIYSENSDESELKVKILRLEALLLTAEEVMRAMDDALDNTPTEQDTEADRRRYEKLCRVINKSYDKYQQLKTKSQS